MKILVAPDKFKSSLTATEVCDAIEKGLLEFDPSIQVKKVPMADGGEGSLKILEHYMDLDPVHIDVTDPLRRLINTSYFLAGPEAYIEMASASGLDILEEAERDCMQTTSFGTGQLIMDAYNRGARHIYLFVGGSATTDAGIGILSAMGIKVLGGNKQLSPVGSSLIDITGFQIVNLINDIRITVVCDVSNPLYGPDGAAVVYGPQKGADAAAVAHLDRGLRNFAEVVQKECGREVSNFEGAGAAGGVAAGIAAFYPTIIKSGTAAVIEIVGLKEKVATADLIITGEGKLDHQTLQGKVVKGVQDLCNQHLKKVCAICGILDLDADQTKALGLWKIKPLVRKGTTLKEAIANAYELVSSRAFELLEESQHEV